MQIRIKNRVLSWHRLPVLRRHLVREFGYTALPYLIYACVAVGVEEHREYLGHEVVHVLAVPGVRKRLAVGAGLIMVVYTAGPDLAPCGLLVPRTPRAFAFLVLAAGPAIEASVGYQ